MHRSSGLGVQQTCATSLAEKIISSPQVSVSPKGDEDEVGLECGILASVVDGGAAVASGVDGGLAVPVVSVDDGGDAVVSGVDHGMALASADDAAKPEPRDAIVGRRAFRGRLAVPPPPEDGAFPVPDGCLFREDLGKGVRDRECDP